MKAVRILIADNHEVVRLGIRSVLERQPGWIVCGEASTGWETVTKALELRPDVVVVDVSMPDMNGAETTREIRRALPVPVVITAKCGSQQGVREAIDAGASCDVSTAEPAQRLVDALRALVGPRVISRRGRGPAGAEGIGEPATVRERGSRSLTRREREVLRLLAEGGSNKEIAALLGISIKTAETHRARIMTKLAVHSMSGLVRYAIRSGVIEP